MSLLMIHLGALGAVVRSTSLLKAIKRRFPHSSITWVVDAPGDQLLREHPFIDRVLTSKEGDLLQLTALEFDIAFVIDKSLKAAGILKQTSVDQVYGFVADPKNGAILPATAAAEELWELGLDDHQKFFVNKKPETQLMVEALELGEWSRDEYFLPLTSDEENEKTSRQVSWSEGQRKLVIGINTGCSDVIAYKKLTVEMHRHIIAGLLKRDDIQIVLLGGPEDSQRNAQIARNLSVIESNTQRGLRDGLISVAACDVILTGDSLGMHMAIAQRKYVVAWFGPTCAHEIDFYGRGESVQSKAPCAPCWKRLCSEKQMCYDQVSEIELQQAIIKGIHFVRESSCANSLFGRPAVERPAVKAGEGALA